MAPRKCRKVLFVLQTLSKVSVDEVFMHYFEKMSFLGVPPDLIGALPLDFRPSDPLIIQP